MQAAVTRQRARVRNKGGLWEGGLEGVGVGAKCSRLELGRIKAAVFQLTADEAAI